MSPLRGRLPGVQMQASGWAVVALLLAPAGLSAKPFPPDPVELLRQALHAPIQDSLNRLELDTRKTNLEKRAKAVLGLSELRRGLELQEWRDRDRDVGVAAVDQSIRLKMQDRLAKGLRDRLTKGTTPDRLAAVIFIGQMGIRIRDNNHSGGYARNFTRELATVLQGADAREAALRQAAARALGQINPEPDVAGPALAQALTKGDADLRQAAAEGLVGLAEIAAQLSRPAPGATDIEMSIEQAVLVGSIVVPLAAKGVADDDVTVRRRCLDALAGAAKNLADLIPDARPPEGLGDSDRPLSPAEKDQVETYRREASALIDKLRPLAQALNKDLPGVVPTLRDADAAVCRVAAQFVEAIATTRYRWHEYVTAIPGPAMGKPAEDPFQTNLPKAIPRLEALLKHKDLRARLAAVYALESLAAAAAPAAGGLAQALKDENPFVRWGAARALDNLAPLEADKAVPELARVLDDANADVRHTALSALQAYADKAAAAVPALTRAVGHSDVAMRVPAIQALVAVGTDAKPAIPALEKALGDSTAEVRAAAAQALGRFGTDARPAVPALQKARDDADPRVRQAANDALLDIR